MALPTGLNINWLLLPNDGSSKPFTHQQTIESFEGSGLPSNWTALEASGGGWVIDNTVSTVGSQSLRSVDVLGSQRAEVVWRGYFAAGQLAFDYKGDYDAGSFLVLSVDSDDYFIYLADSNWASKLVNITAGAHTIKWSSWGRTGVEQVWIDNLRFFCHQPRY